MQAVIYCRVSTVEQTENLSLPTQEEACRNYCARQGWEVDRVFVERGESAKTADRPELQALLGYCRKRRRAVQYLVVYNLSRFARDKYDHFSLQAFLKQCGITLRSVTETFDDTATGKMLEGILATFAQFDNDVRSERTVTGMQAAVKRGAWVFPLPVGYRSKDGEIELDPEASPYLQDAFERFASGTRHQQEIVDHLNQLGIRTRFGGPLSRQSLAYLLRNPFYAGRVVLPKWGVDTQGLHPPLVDELTFSRVQARLAGGGQALVPHMNDHPDFPLRRFVRCGACGAPLTGGWSRGRSGRYGYYWCQRLACRKVKGRRELLEEQFVEHLESLRPRPQYLGLFREVTLSLVENRTRTAREARATMEGRIQALELRKERLIEAYVYQRAIDEETYRTHHAKLSQDLAEARAALVEDADCPLDFDRLLDFAVRVAQQPGDLWRQAALPQKQRLQTILFPQGVTYSQESYRTAATCLLFSGLRHSKDAKARMVPASGLEPETS